MNRIALFVLAVVATSGCATASPDTRLETLMARLERAERALQEERQANLDLAMGRTSAPAAQPQTAPTAASTAAPTPAPTQAPAMAPPTGGYARVASAAYVATPPPWQGQTDSALEVRVHVSTQNYAVGIVVNGTVVPIRYGDATFPTTLQVATPNGRVQTPVVPPTDDVVRVLVPRVGQASFTITCYAVAAGTGQPFARWTRTVTVPTTSGVTVFEHDCLANRIR